MCSWIDNRPVIQYDIKILCVLPSLFNRGVVPRKGLAGTRPICYNKGNHNIFMSPYLSRIEGPPPKRQFIRIRLEPKIEYFLYKSQ